MTLLKERPLGMTLLVWRTPAFWHYWLPPLIWSMAILVFSGEWGSSKNTLGLVQWLLSWLPGLTPVQVKAIHHCLRKLVHVLAYATLYFLWFRAFQGHGGYSRGRSFLVALGLCVLFALIDEGHQAMMKARTGTMYDVALDLGGVALGALVTMAVWNPGSSRTPSEAKTGDHE